MTGNPVTRWLDAGATHGRERPRHGRSGTAFDWTLGHIVTAVVGAGLEVRHLEEYAEPFWRMGGVDAAAFRGRLPNAFALLATCPPAS